jgi:tetratricopeptide (TPR) repeat protein
MPLIDPPAHASSKYWTVTDDLIDKCQRDFQHKRDLSHTAPSLSAAEVAAIAVESMEADQLVDMDSALTPGYPLEQLSDWSLTVLAEQLMQAADAAQDAGLDRPDVIEHLRARAWTALELALDSPIASPLVWYEDIFLDVAQEYWMRGDRRAIDLVKRGLAHDLRHYEGKNAENWLRDLAEAHLWVGELDEGLTLFAALLRNDPGDVWIYNGMAFMCSHIGLADLGAEAASRGLALLDMAGDPDRIRVQLDRMLDEL